MPLLSATEVGDSSPVAESPVSPTNVCIANPWFYPVLVGPGERFRRYAPGFFQRGIQLSVVTAKPEELAAEEVVDGIPVTRIASASGSRFRERTVAYRALSRFFGPRRPDVFQVFSSTPLNVPLVWALRARGVESVYVATMVAEGSGTGRWGWLRKLFRAYVLSGYSRIVTSSGVMTDILRREAWGRDERVVTIPNGVDLKRFHPPAAEEKERLRERLGIGPEPAVLFVGGIYPRKAVDTLLRAWHQVSDGRDVQLIVVGPRPDEEKFRDFHAEVDRLTREAPDPEKITFTGGVRNVDEYMKACDLFVFPSKREGMPNVVPEAMATGLPSILTPFKGLPEEFGRADKEFLLVDRTPEGLAGAMGRLLDDPAAAARLGADARSWVENNLDVEHSLDAYARLYTELATG